MSLFDSHSHIQGAEFADDLDEVVRRAADAGIVGIVIPAIDLETADAALALTSRYAGLYASAGFHPHEASRYLDSDLTRLRELLARPEVVAIGECGLDYHFMHSSREEQLSVLEVMLRLAEESSKPLIIHCREAWDDLDALLKPWASDMAGCKAGQPLGVLHYFSGNSEQAEAYYDLGFKISIHTSVTHPRAAQLREVSASLPLEALILETDAPYGAPQSVRGKRNEPAYLVEAAATIAEVRGVNVADIAAATTANAIQLFGLSSTTHAPVLGAAV